MTEAVLNIVTSTENYLKQLNQHIEEHESDLTAGDGFNLEDFCLKFENVVQEISKGTTEIVMAFTKPPYPDTKESQEIMNSIEGSSSCMVSLYHVLPRDVGNYFHFDVFKLVWDILKSLLKLIEAIDIKGCKDFSARDRLKAAGNVFNACEEVKNMPKNNLKSILNFLHSEELLLLDSLQEIVQEVLTDYSALKFGEEIDNTEIWNNEDRELLPSCIALVKAARSALKKITLAVKTNGDCKSSTSISELDTAAMYAGDLSPVVGVFVRTTYPPMNRKAVKRTGREVVSTLQMLLNKIKTYHFIKEEDRKWLDFLLKFVDYNNNRLQPLLSQEIPEECDEIEE